MTPSLAVTSTAPGAAVVAVDMDEDVILTGVHGTTQATVSRDQTDNPSNVVNGIAGGDNFFCYLSGQGIFVPLKIPLSEGSRIFVAFKAAGTTVLSFDRPA